MNEENRHFYEFGAFRLDASNRLLLRDGKTVPLKPKVVETLLILIQNRGRLISKTELLDQLWKDTFVEEANLTQNIYLLRKALGEGTGESRFIETIPRRGYRFIADVKERENIASLHSSMISAEEDNAVGVHARDVLTENFSLAEREKLNSVQPSKKTIAPAAPKVRRNRNSLFSLIALILIIAAVTIFYVWRSGRAPEATIKSPVTAGIKSIAVVPFKSLMPEAENKDFIGAGMADALIMKLSRIESLQLPPTSQILKYADRETDSLAAGRELNADAVLEGSFQRVENSIRVNARLIRVSDGASLWSGQFDESFTNVFAVQDSISEQVADSLKLRLNESERARLRKHYTDNIAAYEAYLKGRYFWNKRTTDGYQKAIEFFEQSINLDRNYALAYAGLADCYMRLNEGGSPPSETTVPLAKAATLKALEIDDSLAEAHATLGFISYRFDWDFSTAERELRKSLELDPDYAIAHQWYAFYLLATDKQTEAFGELNRARELDPLSLNINSGLGLYFYFTRQYEQAVTQLQKTIELDPNFAEAHWTLGLVYEQQNQFEKAIAEFQILQNLSGGNRSLSVSAARAHLYAVTGKTKEARQLLDEMLEKSKQSYVSAYDIAIIYAGLGETEKALEWLKRAKAEKILRPVWMKFDPRLDSLRSSKDCQS